MRLRPFPTLLALTAAAAFGGFAATALQDTFEKPAQASPAAVAALPAMATLPTAVDGQAVPSLAPMLKRVTPAVVSVYSRQTVRVASPLGPFADDPFFRRIFGIPDMPRERVERALGSGVIVDAARGYVLTNHHVIVNSDGVSVTLSDGRSLEAEFIGSDPDTDIALIKVPSRDLTAAPLGNSQELQVGDFVVAIGNPYGLGQTVTSGIVSAVGRSGIPVAGYQNFIQTDASINPGNSGGPLVNLRGQLVGINTASFNPRGSMAGNIGLGFAIPIDLAHNVMRQLIANHGVVRRGTLGIETQQIDERLAASLGLDTTVGALVVATHFSSSAQDHELKPGDVILAANDIRIDSPSNLDNFIGLQNVGDRVRLRVLRDGKNLELSARIKERIKVIKGDQVDSRLRGIILSELSDEGRATGARGVRVQKVEASSPLSSILQPNDVLVASNLGAINDLEDFRSMMGKNGSRNIKIRVQRSKSYFDILI